ncbi:unnamed protein product [Malus baccata var. baccata]
MAILTLWLCLGSILELDVAFGEVSFGCGRGFGRIGKIYGGGESNRSFWVLILFGQRKTNENNLKTLSFNDKDKIKGKVNSTMIDFLV